MHAKAERSVPACHKNSSLHSLFSANSPAPQPKKALTHERRKSTTTSCRMLNSHGYSDLQIQIIVALTETSPTMENCAVMSHAMCFTKAFICSLCSILIVTFPGAFTYKTFTPSLGKSSTFNQCNMVSSPFSSQWTPSHLQ